MASPRGVAIQKTAWITTEALLPRDDGGLSIESNPKLGFREGTVIIKQF
jgi:hypothetical protein